ncbi:hypothetical protein AAHC03_05878 [Spirometra sp. Aus1]
MEVRKTKRHFIITNGPCALFCDREDGSFKVGPVDLFGDIESARCLGTVEGVLGKFQCHPKNPWCLLLIRESVPACVLHDGVEIRRIVRIAILSLTPESTTDFEINPCPKHADSSAAGADHCEPNEPPAQPKIKNLIKNVADVVGLRGTSRIQRRRYSTTKHRLRYERQMLDEIEKLFQGDCDNFYYSPQGEDITNWTQRRVTAIQKSVDKAKDTFWQPLWRRVNTRVVWNNSLLSDAIEKAMFYLTELGLPASHGGQTHPDTTTATDTEDEFIWHPSDHIKSLASLTDSLRALERMLVPVMNGFVQCKSLELRPNHMLGSAVVQGSAVPSVKVDASAAGGRSSESLKELEELRTASFQRLRTPSARKSVRARNVSNRHLGPEETPPPTRGAEDVENETDKDSGAHRIRITLISRRSHKRAGCRFRRRGIDEHGSVANYVETEQILEVLDGVNPHVTAFLQLRGSVPVFWSQSGIRYRPPINLDKTEAENKAAFTKHMTRALQRFRRVIILNLVDSGLETQEHKLVQAYIRLLLLFNNPSLTYVGFDFHEYCRGLHFEHVSVLLNGLKEIIRNMKFCWLTHDGLLSKQDDVFRVNCVDCLDRTNLVQSVFGSLVIETQLRKLGLLSIDEDLPIMFHRMLQGLWANNGDALSRQYTGTVAMKGDFTRTGLRTMNGLVRDGVSSVNRYYHRFGEIRRQAAIDFILGHTTSPELNFIQSCSLPEALSPTPGDAVMQPLLDQCRELCMLDSELSYFEFVATSANQVQKPSRYLDTIGMITDKYLHLVRLTIVQKPAFQPHVRIPVEAIYKIVVGVESRLLRAPLPVLQIYYKAPTVGPGDATETSLSSVDNVPVAETNAKPETGLSPDENVFGVRLPPGPQTLYAATMQTASANAPLHATILHYEVAEEASEETGTTTPGGVTDTEESDAAPSMTTASEASRATARGQQPTAAEHYLSFRQPGVRLFNNTLIPVSNDEEAVEALRAVADSLCIILKSTDHDVDLQVVLPPNRLISPKRLNPPPQFCFPLDQESLQANFSRLVPSTRAAGGILSSSRFWAVTESQLSMYEQDSIASDASFVNYDRPLQLTQTDAGRWPTRTTQLGRQLRFRNTLKNINTAIRSGINRMNIRPPRPANAGGGKPPSQRDVSVESAPDTTYISSSSSDLSQENVQSEGPDATNYERDTDDNEDEEAAAAATQKNRKELQSGGESKMETTVVGKKARVRRPSTSSISSLSENLALDGLNSDEADATNAHSPAPRRSQGSLLHPPLRKPSLSEQTIPNLDSLRRDLLTRLIAEGQPVEDVLCKQQYQANEQVDDHVRSCGVLFRPVAGPGGVVANATQGLSTLVKSKIATSSTDGYLSSSGLLFPCCGRRPAQGLDTADYAVGFVDGVVPSEEGRFRKAVVEQNEGVSDYWHQMTLLSLQLSAVEGTASKSSGGDVTRDSTGSLPTKNSDLTSEGEANDSEKKRLSTTNPDVTVSGEQASTTMPPAVETDGQEMPVSTVTKTTATEPPAPSPRDQVLAQFKRFDNFCLPDIGFMNSPKLVEKLLKRQLENALDVEHQRRLMCPESQIRTNFIIF